MATLLLELFSEEIPSRMQAGAASQLSQLIVEKLKLALLTPGGPVVTLTPKQYVSPRHLAISIGGLPLIQPDYVEERRGPKIGAPEQALKGFLSAVGLTVDQCEQREGHYYAAIERKGRAMADVIKEIAESALTNFAWPKSMRWGNHRSPGCARCTASFVCWMTKSCPSSSPTSPRATSRKATVSLPPRPSPSKMLQIMKPHFPKQKSSSTAPPDAPKLLQKLLHSPLQQICKW